jgi:hypothetical protein
MMTYTADQISAQIGEVVTRAQDVMMSALDVQVGKRTQYVHEGAEEDLRDAIEDLKAMTIAGYCDSDSD